MHDDGDERDPLPDARILPSLGYVAAYLGKPVSWMRRNKDRLEAEGFPQFDSLLEGWDRDAISVWLDQRSGIKREDTVAAEAPPKAPSPKPTKPTPQNRPKVYTVKMAAARMGYTADTIYKMINRGELACIRRPNCAIRIKEEHILEYEARFEHAPNQGEP